MRGSITMAAAIAVAIGAFAETYTWQGTGASILTAGDWNTPGNWSPSGGGSGVPGSDDVAKFPSPANYNFITSGVPVSVGQIDFGNSGSTVSRTVIVGDSPLTVNTATKDNRNAYFYIPVQWNASTYVKHVHFCDTFTAMGNDRYLIGNYSKTFFRYDLFAKSAASSRSGEFSFAAGQIRPSGSSIAFRGVDTLAEAATSAWSTTAGSPYLSPIGAPGHALPAGTIVSCDGVISPGAFLKRIFPDGKIEISTPALATSASATVTFDPFNPSLRQTFTLRTMGTDACTLNAEKYNEGDDFVLTVDTLDWGSDVKYMLIDTSSGFVPAKIVFSGNASHATAVRRIRLGNCLVEITGTGATAQNGFANTAMSSRDADAVSRLSVPENLSQTIRVFTNMVGTVVKEGAGTLSVQMTQPASVNSGCLKAAKGTLAVTAPAAVVPGVGTLEVVPGATFKLPAGGMEAKTLVVSSGATIEGPGELVVGGAVDLTGVSFTGGASIRFTDVSIVEPDGLLLSMPGNPAFWVDCSRIETMDCVEIDGRTHVRTINDVRGAEYGFATNASGGVHLPYLVTMQHTGLTALGFYGKCVSGNSSEISDFDTMVWKDVIYNIRHVFQVFDGVPDAYGTASGGGGQYLGTSNRAPGNYMMRDLGDDRTDAIFHATADVCSRNGEFRICGKLYDTTQGYPYMGDRRNSKTTYVPLVTDLKTAAPYPPADTFDFNCRSVNRGGRKQLCELIVYTNDVSEADRIAVTAYLMKKWNRREVSYEGSFAEFGDLGEVSAASLSLDAGSSAKATIASDSFTKAGGGALTVERYQRDSGSLSVAAGTLEVATTAIPPGLSHHFDASDLSSLTYTVVDGVTNVTAWADTRGAGYPEATLGNANSTNPPTLRVAATLGGRPYMDFGEFKTFTNDEWKDANNKKYASALTFTATNLHVVVAVWGSERGGGSIAGGWGQQFNDGYGLIRGGDTHGSLASEPVLNNINRPWTSRSNYTHGFSYDFFLDGMSQEPHTASLSGGFQIATYRGIEEFGSKGFSYHNGGSWAVCGGEQFAEYLLFTNGLSDAHIRDVEAYLRKKWFGIATPGYGDAVASNVTVAAGATLKVIGDGRLNASSLSVSGGTIQGAVALAAGAVIEVPVSADGSTSAVAVSGDLDISGGGTVRLVGAVGMLGEGDHLLVTGAGLRSADGWMVDTSTLSPNRFAKLKVAEGNLVLSVRSGGLIMMVR